MQGRTSRRAALPSFDVASFLDYLPRYYVGDRRLALVNKEWKDAHLDPRLWRSLYLSLDDVALDIADVHAPFNLLPCAPSDILRVAQTAQQVTLVQYQGGVTLNTSFAALAFPTIRRLSFDVGCANGEFEPVHQDNALIAVALSPFVRATELDLQGLRPPGWRGLESSSLLDASQQVTLFQCFPFCQRLRPWCTMAGFGRVSEKSLARLESAGECDIELLSCIRDKNVTFPKLRCLTLQCSDTMTLQLLKETFQALTKACPVLDKLHIIMDSCNMDSIRGWADAFRSLSRSIGVLVLHLDDVESPPLESIRQSFRDNFDSLYANELYVSSRSAGEHSHWIDELSMGLRVTTD